MAGGPAGAHWSVNIALVSALKGQMETPPHLLAQIAQANGLYLRREGAGPEPQLLPASIHKVKKTLVQRACHRENSSFTSLFIFNFLFPPKCL